MTAAALLIEDLTPMHLREVMRIDRVAYPEPWTALRVFERVDWRLEETVCLDDASFEEFERSILEYGDTSASSP